MASRGARRPQGPPALAEPGGAHRSSGNHLAASVGALAGQLVEAALVLLDGSDDNVLAGRMVAGTEVRLAVSIDERSTGPPVSRWWR